MAKTYKNLFKPTLTFSSLLDAHFSARKGKRFRRDVIEFEMNLEGNIIELYNELKNKTYTPGEYLEFVIYEPKKRLIKAAPYRDRVIHQWYVKNFIIPIFGKAFIYDSYACIEGKGMHSAAYRVQDYLKAAERKWGEPYILKGDIKSYFFSIDHTILYNIVASKIKDPEVLWLTKIILGTTEDPGIPVGSYTSQWFANLYLHQLDMFIKHKLKVKMHVRYMDDWVLVFESKEQAKYALEQIKEFTNNELKLELNKKTQIFPVKNGVNFCGYKIWSTHMKIRDSSKKRMKRKMKAFQRKYANGEMTLEEIKRSVNSWKGYAKHADSYLLIDHMFKKFVLVKNNKINNN